MIAAPPSLPLDAPSANHAAGFDRWRQAHRSAVTMAASLSFAPSITFFTGDLSVMRETHAADVAALGLWWLLYGAVLWSLLLVGGYLCQFGMPAVARPVRGAIWLLCACVAAACASLAAGGRADILVEQGVVLGARAMHLMSMLFSVPMALLYFAHLRRSRTVEAAAARLAAAQAAQRETQRRTAQARLAAVQARIDPHLLFEMLDAVRHSYAVDSARAECLLDELIAFLRAALPRLHAASSSVPREAELARAYARLHTLAGAHDASLTVEVAAQAMHARFPPGVLLPLLADALRQRAGPCHLAATRANGECKVRLTLPARSSEAALARVRSLLLDLYGAAAGVSTHDTGASVSVTVDVPYELA
jgi:Histidine kinase